MDAVGFALVATGEAQEQSFVVDESDLTTSPSRDWQFAAAVIEAVSSQWFIAYHLLLS